MPMTLALAGNPNCGKTTMFNALTGSRQYVGNRPGVTVEQKTGQLRNHKGVEVTDLPGIYSLSPYTAEEVITRDYLLDRHPDAIINLVDASNLERNLYLTTQVCELGIPVVIALNMMDVAEKRGDRIDLPKLRRMLGCEIVPTSALKGTGLTTLSEAAVRTAKLGHSSHPIFRFSPGVEEALFRIEALMTAKTEPQLRRWFAMKVLERDERVMQDLDFSRSKQAQIEAIIAQCEKAYGDEGASIIINERYDYITTVVRQCVVRPKTGSTISDKADNILTNRYLALPIFALILCGIYAISMQGIGAQATGWTEGLVEQLCLWCTRYLSALGTADWLTGLLVDGLIRGVGAVLAFVPQLCILFLFLALLEDCGYMARIAFILDRIFRRFGLSGKSFIPLLVASGCGVPGIMSCRTIEGEADRRITVMVTTFVPCGAKLPIIALIAGTLFHGSTWVAISVYFVGIFMVFLSGALLKKTKAFAGEPAPFVMEMPPYRLPSITNVSKHVQNELHAFVGKAGTVIFLACGILWFLSNFSLGFHLVETSDSMLAFLGSRIAPLFAPLGFGQWQSVVATLSGLAAKENIVSTLNILYGGNGLGGVFTPLSGYAFLLFNMLCSPCVAAMGAIRREMGSLKWTLFALGYQTGLAYVVTLLFYQLGSRL
ncbi:MAG: ferrous iron transport protein B [Clostridia bacterium]|nr:ferrous iron transport protein B [Clostridia bacterium]